MTHSGKKTYQCKDCNKCFRYAGNLRRHAKTHTEKKPVECKESVKGVSGPVKLEAHVKKKERRDSNDPQLETHASPVQKKKQNQGEQYTCWICSEEFSSKTVLRKHYDDHLKDLS